MAENVPYLEASFSISKYTTFYFEIGDAENDEKVKEALKGKYGVNYQFYNDRGDGCFWIIDEELGFPDDDFGYDVWSGQEHHLVVESVDFTFEGKRDTVILSAPVIPEPTTHSSKTLLLIQQKTLLQKKASFSEDFRSDVVTSFLDKIKNADVDEITVAHPNVQERGKKLPIKINVGDEQMTFEVKDDLKPKIMDIPYRISYDGKDLFLDKSEIRKILDKQKGCLIHNPVKILLKKLREGAEEDEEDSGDEEDYGDDLTPEEREELERLQERMRTLRAVYEARRRREEGV